jgi:hypothetical protein
MPLVLSIVQPDFLPNDANQQTSLSGPMLKTTALPRPFFNVLPLYQTNEADSDSDDL